MISLRPLPQGTRLSQPSTLLATWFGSGLIKPASGTWGSLASLPFIIAILYLPSPLNALALGIFILASFIIGLWAARTYMHSSGTHDASEIVIDETCGLAISFLPLLMYNGLSNTALMIYSAVLFLLFRFYDAAKPWPISWMDKNIGGAFGVMIDDCAAGIFTCLTFGGGLIIWAQLV